MADNYYGGGTSPTGAPIVHRAVEVSPGIFADAVVVVDGSGVLDAAPVTYTNRSGTIASGGAAQVLMAENTSRKGFLIQNLSVGDLWISSLGTAAATQPSLWMPAGSYYEPPSTGVPTAALSIFGATTGQAFSSREW